MTVEELNIVISANDRKFNEAIDEVIGRLDDLEDQSRRTTDDIGNFFTSLGHKLAALGIGKIIGDSIMSGGELEQQLGGVEVVFREHAEAMKKAAATAFEDMGLSESDYLAKANKMGALLKGSGFDTGYAADMSQQIMQRASDVASIMGVDVKDAMEAVTGAAKGNFTMMDNLGVAMNDTTLQAYAQEKGLGKLESTQQKVNAAMQMFLDKTEYAAGNYARENDTFSGSLTTAKAQLENMTADLGTQLLPTATTLVTIARDGLELISPLVVSLGEGLNSAGQYLLNMSPGAKTMLAIAVGAAVAIPAAAKAQAIWNAVNTGWSKVLDILIPKEITRANVLKATAGWLAIVASLLAVVASVGATAREMGESESDSMDSTADSADKAAESVDNVSASFDGLNDSAKAAKRSLADIDTLNVFGSSDSTGGVDFDAIVSGAESAQDSVSDLHDTLSGAAEGLDELGDKANGLDLSGLKSSFSTTFGDIGTGFKTMWNSIFGNGKEQYDSLVAWNENIKGFWGEDWTTFWNNIGSTLYQAFCVSENTEEHEKALRDIEGFLGEIDGSVQRWFDSWTGDFGTKWHDFWFDLGSSFDDADYNRTIEETQEFSDLYQQVLDAINENLKSGMTPEEALSEAKSKVIGNSGRKEYYFEEQGYNKSLNLEYVIGLRDYYRSLGLIGSEQPVYQDYSAPESTVDPAPLPGTGAYGPSPLPATSEVKQYFEVHTTVELDGAAVGESVTNYQAQEAARSNGY